MILPSKSSNKTPPLCAIEVPGSAAVPGETKPYVNYINTTGKLIQHTQGVHSLYDNYLRGRARAGRNAPVFGYRPTVDGMGNVGAYRWITWDLFHERFVNLASGLRLLGMHPGDRIGILMDNSVEWVLTEFASYYHRLVSVPMYVSFGAAALRHIINEVDMKVIVCTSKYARIVLGMIETIPCLQTMIMVDEASMPPSGLLQAGITHGLAITPLRVVEDSGARQPVEPETLPAPDDVATIVYTSGTSGTYKGVVLTHANILATISSTAAQVEHGDMYPFSPDDCSMGFLPLAHCLGRMTLHVSLAFGTKTAFPRSDPAKLVEDLKELQPTMFVGVPRIFNRIQDKILSAVKVKGGLPSALFQYAYSTKRSNLSSRGQARHWLWDRIIFKPLRDKFGGKLKLIISGSAPISPETLEFLRCCFSCKVLEGYGLSETIGPTTVTQMDDTESGNVGAPIPCAMMKLRSVPDLGYTVDDMPYPRGEIMIKGGHTAREYYGQPELTRQVYTDDGWLCTSDIGFLDSRNRLHIIDRKNNLFKLAQGEFIAPEKIENTLMDHFAVSQAFVYGDPLKSALVAIVVPDETLLPMFLRSKGALPPHYVSGADDAFSDLCNDVRARQEILSELSMWCKTHDLCGYEVPKNIYLLPVPFDKTGLLTPTLKLKRREAKAYFASMLDDLYKELN
ncbi:medium-chain fatty acid-CoA ligase faa2 [Coemansia sp. RSA 1813]|nr:medium-chain fatty acid-CoA ligase faa2 [Coemansia sp. RSA 1646]KAJ1771173.1 medium-chain fatty acid-CoA ligase faa2 [Coemansia sp. RSA 1843]KAJ2087803.1 medium-chain fatty acid-CoA ligase faa2 [Coemansia sp. RSA 986]KAJ2212697.1 medium-chain fatty acid-CoA ligase faa2 [Coemansia sp. RSA 487]KAJ2567378.1 medium-chain fatty acid-CoA ligase faa2 [Coemansia sp. RSA 1813]